MKKFLIALMLLSLVVSAAYAADSPLDTLKTTWEQSIERATQLNRENAGWSPVWTRMERKNFAASASATALPNGYDPRGEILPFMKIVAENSGGRIRYETMGYTQRGVPMPVAIVGYPVAPKNPGEVGNRVKIRWQCSIHGGENDGAEASLIFLREVAQGKWDDLLKNDVVLLITPAANPDGKNAQTREYANGSDPNRVWSDATLPEVRAALKLYRDWDPHIVIDHHNIGTGGILRHRHIVTATSGKWGNNDPENDWENTSFSEGLFGDGIQKYRNDDSFYKAFLREFIDDYSRGNTKGNPVYSLSDSLTSSSTSSYSPDRNKDLSLVSMPYMEAFNAAQVTRNGVTRWEVIAMPNPGSDSVRSTATVPAAKNRFSILMEIVTYHHTWLKVNAMYASVISAVDLASKRKEDVIGYFNGKDAEYINLNNDSYNNPPDRYGHPRSVTVYQGAIDYRSTAGSSNTGDGGNSAAPWRKIMPLTGYDHGFMDPNTGQREEIFQLDGHVLSSASAVVRYQDYTHYPRAILNNIPQWPVKMGAFYILDPRATNAAEVLMRDGLEVYKLTEDVVLPYGSTYKIYGLDANGNPTPNWGVRQNQYLAYNIVRTVKLPRNRADVIDNYSTEANKISPNFATSLAGQAWVPLTSAQTPSTTDAPTFGGGEWMLAPEGHVAPAGHYVIPMTQKWARFGAFKLEPRSNCGLLFWGHYNSAVTSFPNQFDLDLVKVFDFTAIPKSALEHVYLVEDMNLKPAQPFGPSVFANPADLTGATIDSAVQDEMGDFTVTIKSALLRDDMWLTFYFFDEANGVWLNAPENGILAKVTQVAPGVFEAFFKFEELADAGLEYGDYYAIQYTNVMDIFGFSVPSVLYFDNIVVNATPSAEVVKLNGNKNTLIITVAEQYAGGETAKLVVSFSIDNNAAATYVVGPYRVYVDTKGNTQIRECYIVK